MSTNVGELAISLDIELSSNVAKQISQVSEDIASKLKTGIESATGNMSGSLSKGLSKTFSKLSDSTKKAGSTIGQGIADGVQKSTSKIGEIIKANLNKAKAKSMGVATAAVSSAGAPTAKAGITKESLITRRDNSMGMQDNINAQIEQYQAELKALSKVRIEPGMSEDMLKIEQRILSLTDKSDRLTVDIRQLDATIDGFDTSKASSELNQASTAASQLSNQAKKMSGGIKQSAGSMSSLGKESRKSERPLINMKSITRTLVRNFLGIQLLISLVGQGIRKLATDMWNSLNTNTQFKNSLQQIQSNLATAFQPIFQAVMPAINTMMAGLSKATAYIAAFISLLFGKSVQSSNASAKAMKKQTDAMNGYSKAVADAASVTAGFDQLNDITANSGSSAGSSGGSSGGAIVPVNLSPKEIAKVQAVVDQIKSIFTKLSENILAIVGGIVVGIAAKFVLMNWPAITAGITKALAGFTEFAAGISLPIVVAIAAIALLVARMIYLWQTSEKFRNNVIALFNSIKNTIQPFVDFVIKIINDMSKIILDTWNKYGKSILDGIDAFIIGAVETFNLIWTNIIDPIIRPAIEMMSKLWDEHLKGIFTQIANFVGNAVVKALELYNKFIKPIIDWLVVTLGPAFKTVFTIIWSTVGGVLGSILTTVSQVISAVQKIFNGLMTFLEGVFTGDWKKVWKGISDIFGGIFNGLKALFKAPINWIIDGINAFTRALNKVKIPDWVPLVGGKGFNIGVIPRLATGGVLKEPTLNIAGEYPGASSNPEIVAPQNIMAETFRQVLREFMSAMQGGGQVSSQSLQVIVNIGGKKLLDTILDLADEYKRQTGKELSISVGT